MIPNDVLMNLEKILKDELNRVSENETYEDVKKLYLDVSVNEVIDNLRKNIEIFNRFIEIATLSEQYKKNSDYIENSSPTIKVMELFSFVGENIASNNEERRQLITVADKQKEIEKRLEELGAKKIIDLHTKTQPAENHANKIDRIFSNRIFAGDVSSFLIKPNGTVKSTIYLTEDERQNLAAVLSRIGLIVFLRKNGTVYTRNGYGEYNELHWKNIKSIAIGTGHVVGLMTNGKVVATGDNSVRQCDVNEWTDIVAVDAYGSYTIGLKSNGTVVFTGFSCGGISFGIKELYDIIAISAGNDFVLGLKSDGTVAAIGFNSEYGHGIGSVRNWNNIVAISAGGDFAVGLKADGAVVYTERSGLLELNLWTNIVAIASGHLHVIGLKSDGTVVSTGSYNGACNVDDWNLFA